MKSSWGRAATRLLKSWMNALRPTFEVLNVSDRLMMSCIFAKPPINFLADTMCSSLNWSNRARCVTPSACLTVLDRVSRQAYLAACTAEEAKGWRAPSSVQRKLRKPGSLQISVFFGYSIRLWHSLHKKNAQPREHTHLSLFPFFLFGNTQLPLHFQAASVVVLHRGCWCFTSSCKKHCRQSKNQTFSVGANLFFLVISHLVFLLGSFFKLNSPSKTTSWFDVSWFTGTDILLNLSFGPTFSRYVRESPHWA